MKYFYFLVLLFIYFDGFATNYYVNAASGKKEFNGRTPLKAKKTIQEAANLTKAGDTVFVMNGFYTNNCSECNVVDISRSGKKNKYIVYINYPRHHPRLNFNGWAGFAVKGSYIKINGFEIVGNNANITFKNASKQPGSCGNKKGRLDPRYNGNGIVIEGRGAKHPHHVVISNNIVHDCGGGGIGASQADYITVEQNIVYNTSWYTVFGTSAIAFYQFFNYDNAKGYHNVIRRNKCYNNTSLVPWFKTCEINDGNGIIIDDFRSRQNGSKLGAYNARTLIENNICWFNGGTGIHTFQSDHVDIINNTAYCNSQSKGLKAGQILSGLGNDNKIVNNIMVSDLMVPINSNYLNTNITYQNNLHYNVTYPDKAIINITSASCLNGENPAFVLPLNGLKANFKLNSNSPAIGKGNLSLYSKNDFEGNKRFNHRSITLGAYEYLSPN